MKSKRRKDNMKIYVDDAFHYVSESRNYIYFIVGVFVLFVIIGFFVLPLSSRFSGMIDQILNDILLKTEGLTGIRLILFIFSNNLQVSFLGVMLGAALGIFPFINAVINGAVLGYVFEKVYTATGGIWDFWRILPHGIFELPAVFISLGLGIKLGAFILSKNPSEEFRYRLLNSIKVLLFIVMPLLIIAAIIEGLLIT